jgi:hypothetical protein
MDKFVSLVVVNVAQDMNTTRDQEYVKKATELDMPGREVFVIYLYLFHYINFILQVLL